MRRWKIPLFAILFTCACVIGAGFLLSGGDSETQGPPKAISIRVPKSVRVGETFRIEGRVPVHIPDGTIIKIQIYGVDSFSAMTIPDVVIGGEFYIDIEAADAGLYAVEASIGTYRDGDKIVSPRKEFRVRPKAGK